MRLGQRTAEHCEILRIDEDRSSGNGPIARDNTVPGNLLVLHAKIMATVLDKHVPFLERSIVEKQSYSLTRRKLALAVLCVNAALSAAKTRLGALRLKFGKYICHLNIPGLQPL